MSNCNELEWSVGLGPDVSRWALPLKTCFVTVLAYIHVWTCVFLQVRYTIQTWLTAAFLKQIKDRSGFWLDNLCFRISMCFSLSVLHLLVCRHLADHIVEDASVVEIRQLHVCVKPHPHLQRFSCVELWRAHRRRHVLHYTRDLRSPKVCPLHTLMSMIILGVSCSGMMMV